MARTIAKDYGDKRAQILSAAARIFARDGFDRASMNQVAAACGISKANIYHYYPGKDALLFDMLDEYLRALHTRVLAADDPGLDPETRLRRALGEVLRAYQGADDHHRVLIAGLAPLSEERRETLLATQRDLVAHMSSLIAALAPALQNDRGRLRATTMSVFGMLNWYFMWNPGAGTQAREEYSDVVADLLLGGLPLRAP